MKINTLFICLAISMILVVCDGKHKYEDSGVNIVLPTPEEKPKTFLQGETMSWILHNLYDPSGIRMQAVQWENDYLNPFKIDQAISHFINGILPINSYIESAWNSTVGYVLDTYLNNLW